MPQRFGHPRKSNSRPRSSRHGKRQPKKRSRGPDLERRRSRTGDPQENIETHGIGTELAIQALQLCRPSGRVNFADALLWAVARAAAPVRVRTFDEKFPMDGIKVQSAS
jgi:hypothetical protein